MSNMVLDLQAEATKSNSDVVNLLRKAYIIARKLSLIDFEKWINSELNGYDKKDIIPKYRKVYGEIKAWNPYNGWIPVLMNDNKLTDMVCGREIRDSIPHLQSVISNPENNTITINYSSEQIKLFCDQFDFNTDYKLFLNRSNIIDIIEKVKNTILDWSLILEEKGIYGTDLIFTESEKKAAESNPIINNYINIFYGNAKDIQMQQGTIDSDQN